jgi:2Fe-2S ferredoxin
MKTVTVEVTDQQGHIHKLDGIEGWQLMEVIKDYGLPLPAECGGACACATCHVYVDANWLSRLPTPNADEELMLDDAMAPQENSRLSCQIILDEKLEGLKVTLAPNP